MNFLKSAVASAISQGPPFPYTFGDRVDTGDSIWSLFNGTKREDGSNCSIFSFEINSNSRSRLPLAKNAHRKLKTLRHPGVVKILDSVETDTYIYIATERVTPLSWNVKRKALKPGTIKWGLHSVASTIKFINDEATSIHGNIRVSSIYTTESGEWKLAGFEVLSSLKDDSPAIYTYAGLLPDASHYAAPEISKSGWDALRTLPVYVTDSWSFGALIYEVFNGPFSSGDQLASNSKSIPSNMAASYRRLLQANPKSRLSVAHFLEQGRRNGGYFDIPLVKITEFVENMGVKSEDERARFLSELEKVQSEFPEDYLTRKILPELLKAIEFAGGGPAVLGTAMKIAKELPSEDWQSIVMPVVVRLFTIPDRQIRLALLSNLEHMIEKIPDKVVNNDLFPNMMVGFSDAEPLVREMSLKSVLLIIGKLSDRHKNGELLKNLAKTQNDVQPGIRTNTTICLGKIAPHLGKNTRQKVLVAAFTRSLRDPFVHARNAALQSFAATAEYFDENDCATKVLPGLMPSLVDKEKVIRVQAKKTIDVFMNRVKTLTANYPDTVIPESAASSGISAPPQVSAPSSSLAAGAGGIGDSWAGWAISSFAKSMVSVSGGMDTSTSTTRSVIVEKQPGVQLVPGTKPTAGGASGSRPGLNQTSTSASLPTQTSSGTFKLSPAPDNDDGDLLDLNVEDDDPWGSMDAEMDEEQIFKETKKKSNPLPKGLGKKVTSPVGSGAAARKTTSTSTTGVLGRKPVVAKPVVQKKTTPTVPVKDEGEIDEDAWGAWDG